MNKLKSERTKTPEFHRFLNLFVNIFIQLMIYPFLALFDIWFTSHLFVLQLVVQDAQNEYVRLHSKPFSF